MSAIAVPEGMTESQLDQALDAFRGVVGAEHVLTGEAVDEFRDAFWPKEWTQYDPSAVLQPSNAEEIQAIVRLANEHKVPIWTTSQGRNLGLGGGSPRVRGSVVVNLRRMNRVLEINEKLGYAVVEPGVSWMDLYEAIRDGGYNLTLSCTDLGWGSVIGNSLEHGITQGPYGADFMAPCGLEVVLSNGELLRTGMGSLPNSKTFHLYKRALGPMLDQFFMQSNFGVVVKMGLWLMPKPEVYAPMWINVPREEDLIPMVDILRKLRMDRTIEGVPVLYNTLIFASLFHERTRWFNGSGPTPDPIIDQIAKDLNIGRWVMHGALWDDKTVSDYKIEKIRAAFSEIPGMHMQVSQHSPDEIPDLEVFPDRVPGGVPNLEWLSILKWYGTEAGAHTGTGLVAPLDGKEAFQLHTMIRNEIERDHGLDSFANLSVMGARSFVYVFGGIYDQNNEADTKRAYDACRSVLLKGAEAGFGEYRAHLDNMDLAADQYSFSDNSYRRFLSTIKDAVDPNGILAPGKQSIWPAQYRSDSGHPLGFDK
jgi:4-cresol dehydrogenase (hydroxylating)